jgi:hypothetical protein
MVVFRGVTTMYYKKDNSDIFYNNTFMSTSLNPYTAFEFSAKDCCMKKIILKPGFNRIIFMEPITQVTGEYELLICPDTKFRILKHEESKKETTLNKKPIQYLFKGFLLAILNPQLLPFWMFIQVYFSSIPFLRIQSNLQKISYILGSGVGAFILLAFFIIIALKYRETILKYINNKYFFKALSLLFFALAGHQTWLLINS